MATHSNHDENMADNLRTFTIRVRVTLPEKRKFEKLAEKRHTDISELMRQLLHKEADAVKVGG